MSRITNDVDAINQSLNQSLTQVITSAATLIGIIVMMFSISWQMSLIAIITLPVSMLVATLIIKRSQPHFFNQQSYLGEVNGLVEEMYGAHQVVKAFNREDSTLEEFEKSNNALFGAAWRANFLSGMMMPVMNIIGNFAYVVVCVIGAWFTVNGQLPIGDIQAFIQYMRTFQQPIMQLSQISNIVQQTMAAAERVFDFLAEEEETAEESPSGRVCDLAASVDFDGVKFGYNPEKLVIKNFNATVAPGQKIAIVGPTGAGKTTIVKLLMRFYDIDSGDIRIGGSTIYSFPRRDVRSIFGMVLQDTWLYNASIMENIRYGKLDATDEEVKEAAKIAQVDKVVSTLPHGYDMELNEEATNLSAGQKQLLTIARTVLADPRILILDEATSSVDTRTEQLIQRAMDSLMQGRTSFIIAHRLSTIKNADLILVIDEGDIVEQGSHNELLAKGGFYAKLYNAQFTTA
jgi:ATP-binding cassette subfamily B protein